MKHFEVKFVCPQPFSAKFEDALTAFDFLYKKSKEENKAKAYVYERGTCIIVVNIDHGIAYLCEM